VLRAELLLVGRGLSGEMSSPLLRAGTPQDAASIRTLLESCHLPTSDLLSSNPQFIVACEEARIVAAGALQPFGSTALLRSVAVASDLRGTGLGRIIVQDLERMARAAGISRLVLLTESAKLFFQHLAYHVIERQDVPQAVQASEEFRSLCPASATCMAKTLARPSS
jgi:amino-acid N-acetyltransferase